jgi:hypothetical protein
LIEKPKDYMRIELTHTENARQASLFSPTSAHWETIQGIRNLDWANRSGEMRNCATFLTDQGDRVL